MTAHPLDPELLVAHVEGLRGLARSLVGDAHLAEDVVQDAMTAAIRRPPAAGVPLGPWLVGVTRNLARFTKRTDARRAAREHAASMRAAVEAPDAVVARAEVHRRLVDALLALPEPYRATLLRRYIDDEEPTEIARRDGVPAETVRTRVRRGLAMLRESLRADGDDDAWKLALTPLLRGHGATATAGAVTGVLVMTTANKVAAALVLVALGGAAWWTVGRDAAPTRAETTAVAPVAQTPAATVDRRRRDEPAPAPVAAAVDETPAVAAETKPVPPTDAQRKQWPLRVVTNVVGARVTMRVRVCGAGVDPPPETKSTDAKGFVGFAAPAADVLVGRFEFVIRAEGWETCAFGVDRPDDVWMLMRRGVSLRGRVTDAAGRPLAGAHVWRIDPPQEATMTETDSAGAFESFFGAPGKASVRVSHPAFVERTVEFDAPAKDVVVALEHGREVSGRAAFPDGKPVPGVPIYGDVERVATTDADGRYVVTGLTEGRVDIRCGVDGQERAVESGTTGVDFVIDRPVARIRYVDVDGRPFRFVEPRLRLVKDDKDLWTHFETGMSEDPGGVIGGAVGATLLVSATAAGRVKGVATCAFGDRVGLHDVEVRMGAKRPTGAVRVVVRAAAGESPRTACVVVRDLVGQFFTGSTTKPATLDETGGVEFADVPAGRAEVVVSAAPRGSREALKSFLVPTSTAVDVEAGRTAQVEATPPLGGRVRAVVKDAAGKPVRPGSLALLPPSGTNWLATFGHEARDGTWASNVDASPCVLGDAVAPGAYRVHAVMNSQDDVVDDVEVVVAAGLTTDVELAVKPKK